MKIARWAIFTGSLIVGVFILLGLFGTGTGLLSSGLVWLLAAAACWLLVFFLPKITWNLPLRTLLTAGIIILLLLFIPTALLVELNLNLGRMETSQGSGWLGLLLFLLPIFALVLTPLLLRAGAQPNRQDREASACFLLAAALLIKTLHNYYWLLVWDNTDDSLDLLWMIIPVFISIVGALAAATSLKGRARWAGWFALFIPVLLVAVAGNGDKTDFRQFTQQRAERISRALVSYRQDQGAYPARLQDLSPRYLLTIPGPVTLYYRQGWCYTANSASYRLGAVYRNHWSEPLIYGKIFAEEALSNGTLPPLCADELTALRPLFAEFVQFGPPQ